MVAIKNIVFEYYSDNKFKMNQVICIDLNNHSHFRQHWHKIQSFNITDGKYWATQQQSS